MDTAKFQGYQKPIDEVKQYIGSHLDQTLNRSILATITDFSVPHFHRIFSAIVGENLYGYIRRMRMERAGRKLRMGAVDITEVALAAGYDSHAAFSKAFKRYYGLSPSEFRSLDCRSATLILKKG